MRLRHRWAVGLVIAGLVAGCSSTEPAPPGRDARAFPGVKLAVRVLGAGELVPSLKAQRGEWAAQTGGNYDVEPAMDLAALAGADVVVFPADRIGDLAEQKLLVPLPDTFFEAPAASSTESEPAPAPGSKAKPVDPFDGEDILPVFRDQVVRFGPERLGLPLGSSGLVVAYRKSMFDDPATRDAAAKAGVSLDAPRTWDDFDAQARWFQGRDHNGDGQPDHGVALAWGEDPEGVGDATWLARAAAGGFHPDEFSFLLGSEKMEPRVASPPFAESLQAILKLREAGPPDAAKLSAEAARAAFRSGRVALLVDRAEQVAAWTSAGGAAVGIWPLPGSGRIYDPSRHVWEEVASPNHPTFLLHGGGWVVGVIASGSHREAASDLARYLSGPASTDRLRSERGSPMLATRAAQVARGLPSPRTAPGVDPRSWSDAVRRLLENDRFAPGLRLPGATEYMADLAAARSRANAGAEVGPTLDALAKTWSERVEKRGAARQVWFHRRSLPGLVTTPEPPPR